MFKLTFLLVIGVTFVLFYSSKISGTVEGKMSQEKVNFIKSFEKSLQKHQAINTYTWTNDVTLHITVHEQKNNNKAFLQTLCQEANNLQRPKEFIFEISSVDYKSLISGQVNGAIHSFTCK